MDQLYRQFLNLLPESLRESAMTHAQEIDVATANYLVADLEKYFAEICRAAESNKDIDLPLIKRMVAALKLLMGEFSSFSDDQRMVISIALRYFLDADDAQQDLTDRFGFDDDLAVLNAALITIGRDDILVVRHSD